MLIYIVNMGKRILTDARRARLRYNISERRRRHKLQSLEYKGGKCKRCGYDKSVNALSFHHLDPLEKDFTLSSFFYKKFQKIKIELDKCILLCHNCHAEEHEQLRQIEKQSQDPNSSAYKMSLYRRKNKAKAVEYKGGKCQVCNYNKDITVLSFHHVDKEDKLFGISSDSGLNKSWDKISAELDKCVLLCNNCHAEEHATEIIENNKLSYEKMRKMAPTRANMASVKKQCDSCNKEIMVYGSRNYPTNFCSVKCKHEYSNKSWLPDEEILKLLKEKSVKELCVILGKSQATVYERLKRIKDKQK